MLELAVQATSVLVFQTQQRPLAPLAQMASVLGTIGVHRVLAWEYPRCPDSSTPLLADLHKLRYS